MGDAEWIDVMRATARFYEVIFADAGHAIAWDIVQRLNGRISRLRVLTMSAKDRPMSGICHMTAIYDAISAVMLMQRRPQCRRISLMPPLLRIVFFCDETAKAPSNA